MLRPCEEIRADVVTERRVASAGSPSSRTIRTDVVGRDDELRRLHDRVDALLGGDGGHIAVTGEPGIGKTRLLEALVEYGRARGCTTVAGRCVMTTRPQPGGIARDTSVLKTIHRERDGLLAVRAAVRRPGTVHVGDELVRADGD